jgi:nitrogen regulatory protein PII
MIYIVAIMQPGKLEPVQEALTELGVTGMTVSEVQGYGRQKGKSEIYRGAEYQVNFMPKIKIEVAVPAAQAGEVTQAISKAAKSGKIGDGKIFTFALKDALRIRTGETGETAL